MNMEVGLGMDICDGISLTNSVAGPVALSGECYIK
jgi:hypothetical protein